MDELANRLKLDPLEFRLKNSRTTSAAVFEAGARNSAGTRENCGQGFGMGGGYEKLGYIATFAEVA